MAAPVPSPPPSSQDKDQLQKTTAVFHAGCPKVTPFTAQGSPALRGMVVPSLDMCPSITG